MHSDLATSPRPDAPSVLERRVHRVLRDGRHRRRSSAPGVAAEPAATYVAAPPIVATGDADLELDRPQARLAELADLAQQVDQSIARMIWLLADLQTSGDLDVPLPQWLGQVARRTGTDVKMLQAAADVLPTLPATFLAFREGLLSWSQVRPIVTAARRVPLARRDDLDRHLSTVVDEARTWMPDDLVGLVDEHVDRLRPTDLERAERRREQGQYLAMQADLFGGGRIWGDLDTLAFATIAEALQPTPAELQAARRDGEPLWKATGRARAARLAALADTHLAGSRAPEADDTWDPDTARGGRPHLNVHLDLDTLLDRQQTPGWLLHTLTGGRMWASADLIRRLLHERGADLRLIVFDDTGTALGVGRRTRIPPDWLRDAVLATHPVDQAPGSTAPARTCDLDHVDPWRDDGTGGATDVHNLQPLGRGMHRAKTPVDGRPPDWTVTTRPDGTRTWRHRTGLTSTVHRPRRRLDDPA